MSLRPDGQLASYHEYDHRAQACRWLPFRMQEEWAAFPGVFRAGWCTGGVNKGHVRREGEGTRSRYAQRIREEWDAARLIDRFVSLYHTCIWFSAPPKPFVSHDYSAPISSATPFDWFRMNWIGNPPKERIERDERKEKKDGRGSVTHAGTACESFLSVTQPPSKPPSPKPGLSRHSSTRTWQFRLS